VPIASSISNAYISFASMTVSTLALISDVVRDGVPLVGFGFHSNGRYAQSGILRERFLPRLLAAEPETLLDPHADNLDPSRVWDAVMGDEKPGGHGERSVAVGAIDMAIWDLVAKVEGRPLHRVVAERYRDGTPDERVFVYAAGGYYAPGKDRAALAEEMRGYLDQGYTTVKLKIGGASLDEDLRRIEAVAELIPTERIAVDANGRFDTATALAYAQALAPYQLRWFEEPGDPLDFLLQATIGEIYDPPLATGENLFSAVDARNLLRYGGMRADRDVLQFDPALSYGLTEFLRTLDAMRAHGWSARRVIPHGGHQFALAIAAGLGLGGNESYPGVFEPFGGFADDTPIIDGHVAPCEAPGIGHERHGDLYAVLRELL
jgi:L-alanine-DL-glutamate epimerase-like enolase superfamily enzyme